MNKRICDMCKTRNAYVVIEDNVNSKYAGKAFCMRCGFTYHFEIDRLNSHFVIET